MTREEIQENNRRALEGKHHQATRCNCEFETFVRAATIIRSTLYHRDSTFWVGKQGKSQLKAVLKWLPLHDLLMGYLGYLLDDSEFLVKRAHPFHCFTGEETSACLAPGEELTDELKKEMEESVRRMIACERAAALDSGETA
jgi:hypothetical protein